MRSFFVVGGLACLAGILFVKGYLLRPAGAANARSAETDTEIRFEYSDYNDEMPPALPIRPQTQPYPEPPSDTADRAAAPPASDATARIDSERDWASSESAPQADAGQDRVVWMGDNEIVLDGSGSRGTGLSYYWRQLSGPVELRIKSPHVAQTTATGLAQEWPDKDAVYEFELTVRDASGRESLDTASFTSKAAPSITVVPAATHRLAWRDGYLLAHFEAWKTNHADESEVFYVRSASELTFHPLGGTAEYEVTPTERSSGFEYQLTVYYGEPESSSFVEFFVDTPERIPAVLLLGVHWE